MAKQYWISYRSLFRFAGTIHRIDSRTRLPGPLKVDTIIIFLFMLVLLYIPCWLLAPVFKAGFHVSTWFADIAFSIGATCFFTNFDPAGKFLPFYVLDIIQFYCLPKRHRVGSPFRPDRRKREDGQFFMLD